MLGHTLDPVGAHIAHEAGVMGRRGTGVRTVFAVMGAAISLYLNRSPAPVVWLLATLTWEWIATPFATSYITRRWPDAKRALNAQTVMSAIGAGLFAIMPLLAFPSHGALGGMLAVAWIAGSLMHAVCILGVHRNLLVAGLAPIVAVAAAVPVLQWGWTWQAAIMELTLAAMFVAVLILGADASRFVGSLAHATASLHAASDAGRTRTQILSMINDELRKPTEVIQHHAQRISQREAASTEGAERMEDIKRIQDASARLSRLVDQSIEIMRIRAGAVTIHRASTSIDTMLKVVASRWKEPASTHGNTLLIASQNVGLATVDATRLMQALDCFIDNACKFTRKGWIVISCTRWPDRLEFFIADSGVGIASDAQLLMFEPLQQGDASAPRTHDGAGLGLALADCLAGAMGGRIEVRSAPGEGSEFILSIPIPAS